MSIVVSTETQTSMSTVIKLGDSWGQYAGDRPNQVMDNAMWCQQVELQLHQMNDSFP